MKKKVVLSVAVVLLVVMVAMMCVACTPSVDSVEKKFKNNDYYTVEKSEKSLTMAKNGSGIISSFIPDNGIIITWYDNEDDAKKIEDNFNSENGKKFIARKGCAVAIGDEESIKIFK